MRLSFVAALILGLATLADALTRRSGIFVGELEADAESETPAPAPAGQIRLLVALAWEGRDLEDINLRALKEFRARYTDVSFIHFLSPAYFTHPSADLGAAQARIRSVMKAKDQLALDLGGWKSMATAAGVIFRNGPTFWGQKLSERDCASDCGLDIPVNIYPEEDLAKLFKSSLDTLEANGFGRPRGLATEGWVASPHLLEAAARVGMHYDFSAVAAEMLTKQAHLFPLYDWVKNIWPAVTPHTQSFVISTPAGGLTEIPQSLASIDYQTPAEIVALFKEYIELARSQADSELTFPLVVNQETAAMTLPRLASSLQQVFALAAKERVSLAPLVLPGLDLPEAPAGALEPAQPATPVAATPSLVGPPAPALAH